MNHRNPCVEGNTNSFNHVSPFKKPVSHYPVHHSFFEITTYRDSLFTNQDVISVQRAYMRLFNASVKAFASVGESFLPISKVSGFCSVAISCDPV